MHRELGDHTPDDEGAPIVAVETAAAIARRTAGVVRSAAPPKSTDMHISLVRVC